MSIFNTYNSYRYKGGEYDFTHEETRDFTTDIRKCDIIKLTKRFNDPILSELKRMYKYSKSRKFRQTSFEYFKLLFWELYENRNSTIHMAYSIERNRIKLERLIPHFCRKLRYVISTEISKNEMISLPGAIKKLEGTGWDGSAEF